MNPSSPAFPHAKSTENANGVPSTSPGLARGTSAYPGSAPQPSANPERVSSTNSQRLGCNCNPFRVDPAREWKPRVARASQPWAVRWNAVGVWLDCYVEWKSLFRYAVFFVFFTTVLPVQRACGQNSKTLADALVSSTWSWSESWTQLTFLPNGKFTDINGKIRNWEVTGARSVKLSSEAGKPLVTVSFDESLSKLHAVVLGTDRQVTGSRLPSGPTGVGTIVAAVPADAIQPKTLEDSLVNYQWSFINNVPEPKRPEHRDKEVRFFKDGTARTTIDEEWTWKATGAQSIRLHFKVGTPGITVSFDSDYSKLNYSNGRIIGFRLGPVSSLASANGSVKPLTRPQVAGAQPESKAIISDPTQPRIEVLKDQAPNAIEWTLAPLEQAVPGDIRQNLTFLREDLLDEGKQQPKASADAYTLAAQICQTVLAALEERNQTLARAGFRAVEAQARTAREQPGAGSPAQLQNELAAICPRRIPARRTQEPGHRQRAGDGRTPQARMVPAHRRPPHPTRPALRQIPRSPAAGTGGEVEPIPCPRPQRRAMRTIRSSFARKSSQ